MSLWPSGFDPFYGLGGPYGALDPFAALAAPPPGVGGFYDPFWAPGAGSATRRRLNVPALQGVGAAGAGAAGEGGRGEEGGEEGERRRTRDPFVMGSAGWTRSIPCDFIERDNEYVVRADIPGCHKEEIHVEVHDGSVLRFGHNPLAEREKEDVEETGIYHRAERVTTFRNRNLRMPDDADMSGELKASYEDGVLQVIIPKKSGEARPEGRIIQVA